MNNSILIANDFFRFELLSKKSILELPRSQIKIDDSKIKIDNLGVEFCEIVLTASDNASQLFSKKKDGKFDLSGVISELNLIKSFLLSYVQSNSNESELSNEIESYFSKITPVYEEEIFTSETGLIAKIKFDLLLTGVNWIGLFYPEIGCIESVFSFIQVENTIIGYYIAGNVSDSTFQQKIIDATLFCTDTNCNISLAPILKNGYFIIEDVPITLANKELYIKGVYEYRTHGVVGFYPFKEKVTKLL